MNAILKPSSILFPTRPKNQRKTKKVKVIKDHVPTPQLYDHIETDFINDPFAYLYTSGNQEPVSSNRKSLVISCAIGILIIFVFIHILHTSTKKN
jgi:hypothetical protein